MDVERIQKINSLALDLMRQGLAQNREDAVQQAEKIFRSRDGRDNVFLSSTARDGRSDTAMSNTTNAARTDELPTEKVKEILEKNTQFLVKTIKEFQERIAALEG